MKNNSLQLIERITDRMVYGSDQGYAMNIHRFDWVCGVGLAGIWRAYEVTGKKEYLDFLIRWADEHAEEAFAQRTVNSTAPLITVLELYKATGKKEYGQICQTIADSILNEAPLTVDGGLEHTVIESVNFSNQMWGDTLFMAGIFLARYGKMTGERKYIDFVTNQLKLHYKYLWNEEKQLCYHGWDGEHRNHLSGVFWGRANAWILYSAVEILKAVGEFEEREEVLNKLRKHIKGLAACQRTDGLFSTVLDDPQSYEELSASSGIACGIVEAYNLGYIDNGLKECAERAFRRFPQYINDSGEVLSVSGGTPIMKCVQEYKDIPRQITLYGQGLMCLALAENIED